MTPLEQLALEMPTTRGAHPAWVSDMWMRHEAPAWLGDPAMIGALARLPACPDGVQSEARLRTRARRLLQARGDRGWGAFIEVMTHPDRQADSSYWLRVMRPEWPPTLLSWPEERVKAMTFLMREWQGMLPGSAVALFETVETREELTLAHWLTGRTWAKGARMVEVMEAARLTYEGSPRHTSELWHILRGAKKTWLRAYHIAEIDKDYMRSALVWFGVLARERRYHT